MGSRVLTGHTDAEGEITLGLLKAVDGNSELTQRSLAAELGIALGLVNTYLKRCVNKGYIKTRQIPRNRYAYYLTPKGFAEKSKLAAEYFYQSLSLFRQAHAAYKTILETCAVNNWTRLALCGSGDLADIVILLTSEFDVRIVKIYDPEYAGSAFHGHPVVGAIGTPSEVDAWIVTSFANAQSIYQDIAGSVSPERILVPDLLEIQRARREQVAS